jgi:IclR family acetate operon transcriptional repressor
MNTSASEGRDRLVGTDRVLAVLTELARHSGGASLDQLATAVSSSRSTTHRALASLRRAGFAELDGRGRYRLGNEFVRIAFAYHEGRPERSRIQPLLETLAQRFGETAHYAVLSGQSVVYEAKVDSPLATMKLTSSVGGRNPAHLTGVGKLLLSYALPTKAAVVEWVGDRTLERRTPNTIVTAEALHADLEAIRQRGYSIDNEENQLGVNCVALPVFLGSPTVPSGAVSLSAITLRTPLAALLAVVPEFQRAVAQALVH